MRIDIFVWCSVHFILSNFVLFIDLFLLLIVMMSLRDIREINFRKFYS